jgi:hypothetical protein
VLSAAPAPSPWQKAALHEDLLALQRRPTRVAAFRRESPACPSARQPGLPTDPNDPGSFIDIFTDIDPLFVINNEPGWYEGWMIHDVVVPDVAPLRGDGTPQFGKITRTTRMRS